MIKKAITNLSYKTAGFSIQAHRNPGSGLLKDVCKECLKYELLMNGSDALYSYR